MLLRDRLIILSLVSIATGCTSGSDGGEICASTSVVASGLEQPRHYTTDIEEVGEPIPDAIGSAGFETIVKSSNSEIAIEDYRLVVIATVQPVGSAESVVMLKGQKIQGILNYFLGSANATDCPPASDIRVSRQLISDIDIVSSGQIDSVHPAGSSLTNVLKIYATNRLFGSSIKTQIPPPESLNTIEQWLTRGNPAPLEMYFSLTSDAIVDSIHRFTVTYTLADGSTLVSTSEAVTLSEN